MRDGFSRLFECADLTHARNIFAVPLDAELHVLVWIETRWVDSEFSHFLLPCPSNLNLSRHLLQVKNDELSRFQRRESDPNVDYPEIAIALSGGFTVAFHK